MIDRWDEIVQFLNGIDEEETLLSILLDQKQKLRSESSLLFSLSISNFANLIKVGYDVLAAETAMLTTDKTNLTTAYTSYKTKAEALADAITNATDTAKTTDAELNTLKTAASDYSSAVLTYKTVEEEVRQNLVKTQASIIHSDINLLINSTVKKQLYANHETGVFMYAATHELTDYINVSVYNQITISNSFNKPFSNARVVFYDRDKVFLSGSYFGVSYPNKSTVSIPKNTYYLVFSYDVKMEGGVPLSTVMIQSGSVATDRSFAPADIQNYLMERIETLTAVGRNIIPASASITIQNSVGQASNKTITTNLIQGKTYTLSYESTTLTVANDYPQFYVWTLNDWKSLQSLGTVAAKTRSFVWNNPTGAYTFTVYNHNYPQGGTIAKLKLERGNSATNWTPAPEDI